MEKNEIDKINKADDKNENTEEYSLDISMEEIVTYSKQKEVPAVVIVADLSEEDLEYINIVFKRLYLIAFAITGENMVAFIDNSNISKKIAKHLHKRCQEMFYDYVRRPSSITIYALTGYSSHWTTVRDNGYIVNAYDENGNKIEPFINTDIKEVEPKKLNDLGLSIYNITLSFNGKKGNARSQILEHSRKNFLKDGIYNEKRNCYYPADKKDIAEYNKIEKLFKRYGINKL